jgi:hypothetical protein
MCTPSFMCKFPFSRREYVAGREGVPYAWPRTTEHWLNSQFVGAQPMRNRRRPSASPVERLRLAIDCLPVGTREAMLTGLRANARIIAGAYVDREGGVCPMLAAHRAGGHRQLRSRRAPRRLRVGDAGDPSGEIVARRLRRPTLRRLVGATA